MALVNDYRKAIREWAAYEIKDKRQEYWDSMRFNLIDRAERLGKKMGKGFAVVRNEMREEITRQCLEAQWGRQREK